MQMDIGEEKIYCNSLVYLKRLHVNDVTDSYVDWMNNYEIVKYTESRHMYHTLESTKAFIHSVYNNNNYCFGIFDVINDQHIGNIKIGNINDCYKYADVGLIIGNSNYWGKGIAKDAISAVVNFAFKKLNLHRLFAGIYAPNIGSIKAFERAGFIKEGVEKEKYIFEGQRIDSYLYGIINNES